MSFTHTEQRILEFIETHPAFDLTMLRAYVDKYIALAHWQVYPVLYRLRRRGHIDYFYRDGQYHVRRVGRVEQ